MSNHIDVMMEDIIPLINDCLSADGTFTFFPKGKSMLPFIREGIDSVTLSPVKASLRKYDIALYRRDNGKYVLHRVVSVGETYTFLGDNCLYLEPNVRHDSLVAVVTSVNRNGREVHVTSFWFRLFGILWYRTRFFRRVYRGVKRRLSRLFNLSGE